MNVSNKKTKNVSMSEQYKNEIHRLVRANDSNFDSNFINEENFYILRWFYRIRKANCNKGIQIGFLQPDFLWCIIRPMMRINKLWRTNRDIRIAVDFWCFTSNHAKAEEKYGHISDWDVSSVTDMSELFKGRPEGSRYEVRFHGKNMFNDDISHWDVSNVTNMCRMFSNAESFNQNIGIWDVSNVTNMNFMFSNASSFNQYISNWDMSNVIYKDDMFNGAHAFNQDNDDYDLSNLSDLGYYFDSLTY